MEFLHVYDGPRKKCPGLVNTFYGHRGTVMVQHVDSGARLPKFKSFLSAIVLPGQIIGLAKKFEFFHKSLQKSLNFLASSIVYYLIASSAVKRRGPSV